MTLLNAVEPTRPVRVEGLVRLLGVTDGPCISIYMDTTTDFTRADETRLRFRALVDQAQVEVARLGLRRPDAEALLAELRGLEGDMGFWRAHALAGVAVFRSPQEFRRYRLLSPPPRRAVVADSFHVKPLIRIVQDSNRYHVLCLSRKHAALFEGNRYALERVELEGLPHEIDVSLEGEPRVAHTSEDAAQSRGIWNDQAAVKNHFRRVDQVVWEHHSLPERLPLILVGLPETQTLFREVSRNDYLADERVERDPFHAMTLDHLRELTWEAVRPALVRAGDAWIDAFNQAKAHDQGSDDLSRIARAAWEGRVETLLLEADRHVGGRVDRNSGKLVLQDIADPSIDDVLDDLAEMVLLASGRVLILPAERMPTRSGAAAVERYRIGERADEKPGA